MTTLTSNDAMALAEPRQIVRAEQRLG
jgi:hypothetical protein